MVIFHSYVSLPEGIHHVSSWKSPVAGGAEEPGGPGRHVALRGPLDGLGAAEHVAALRGGARHRHHHGGSLPDGRPAGGHRWVGMDGLGRRAMVTIVILWMIIGI